MSCLLITQHIDDIRNCPPYMRLAMLPLKWNTAEWLLTPLRVVGPTTRVSAMIGDVRPIMTITACRHDDMWHMTEIKSFVCVCLQCVYYGAMHNCGLKICYVSSHRVHLCRGWCRPTRWIDENGCVCDIRFMRVVTRRHARSTINRHRRCGRGERKQEADDVWCACRVYMGDGAHMCVRVSSIWWSYRWARTWSGNVLGLKCLTDYTHPAGRICVYCKAKGTQFLSHIFLYIFSPCVGVCVWCVCVCVSLPADAYAKNGSVK